jgi:PiT family inorganic phosphate transporter
MDFGLLIIACFLLAWSNGANDNFKGVATLYGSGGAGYTAALRWATGATLLGSLVSVALAETLIARFSGRGLVSEEMIGPVFLGSVAAAGAATVFLATRIGMPTSTTHALTGALIGTGMTGGWEYIDWTVVSTQFVQPLLLSPFLAIGLTSAVYPLLSWWRKRMGVERQTCVCIGSCPPQPVAIRSDGSALLVGSPGVLTVQIGETEQCVERYSGQLVGVKAQTMVEMVHYLSGAAVCFARAVNDTPKIAALLLAGLAVSDTAWIGSTGGLFLLAFAMTVGGWVHSRRVAETMSKRITDLNPGQGLTANLVTAVLVLGASRLGLPVSTTHVSCGSIFGIGLVTGEGNWSTIGAIATTWITTLPVGMVLGAVFFWLAGHVGA